MKNTKTRKSEFANLEKKQFLDIDKLRISVEIGSLTTCIKLLQEIKRKKSAQLRRKK